MTHTPEGKPALDERGLEAAKAAYLETYRPRIEDELVAVISAYLAALPADKTDAVAVANDDEAVVQYVLNYGGRCRDCADSADGLCPVTCLSCDQREAREAILHVLAAVRYGTEHGYIAAAPPAPQPEPAADLVERATRWLIEAGMSPRVAAHSAPDYAAFAEQQRAAEKARADAAEAELRRTDPNYTPLLDKYATDIQAYADRAEAAEKALAEIAEAPFSSKERLVQHAEAAIRARGGQS
jgi:hypothetical protein